MNNVLVITNMELRVLRYFLAVAHTGNFSAAAASLNLTQPTLSRQIQDLETEVGCQLLIRGKRETRLTEAGIYMRNRAEEIIELEEKTRTCLKESKAGITGDVHIAGGETRAMSLLAIIMKMVRYKYPAIRFHIFSGNAETVAERLDKGLADFGVFIRPVNLEKYEYINLPAEDRWGLLVRSDHHLANRENIVPADLAGLPLICSRQHMLANEIAGWLDGVKPNIVATYNLLYNGALMVAEGLGAALALEGIVSETKDLRFRSLKPDLKVSMDVAWKKRPAFSRAAATFHDALLEELGNNNLGSPVLIPLLSHELQLSPVQC